MRIWAIDPGTVQSAILLWESEQSRVKWSGILPNGEVRGILTEHSSSGDVLAIEMIASYGMSVGKEVFETCLWIGRFVELWNTARGTDSQLAYRKEIKVHICGTAKAKDSNIRQALIDRFGAVGTKKKPGPLYGVSSHLWSALAVAVYTHDQLTNSQLTLLEK